LECEAIKKVRNEWGLTNVIIMVPFCRTPEEGEKVIKTMAEFGLKQGENGLQVYVMCEIPSNVILAEDFAKIFDGFSIGTNDLTQLTLGVDRDSSLVSDIYDENNEAVKNLIRSVIKVAHKNKKKIGICGQAPSDYPKFADFLVREGIDSISLNPDTVLETRKRIASLEKTLGKTTKKPSKKYLSFIGTVALVSSLIIGLGVGCSGLTDQNLSNNDTSSITPAQIRERIEETVYKKTQEENEAKRTTIEEKDFANFRLTYPVEWKLQQWGSGLTLFENEGEGYFSIFEQLVSHPVAEEDKQDVIVGGMEGKKYDVLLGSSSTTVQIVEIELEDGDVLEINGVTRLFDELIEGLSFENSLNLPDRDLTHWDVRDKSVCIQMVTYAKESKGDMCELFSTPCDVPEDWTVCDSDDIIVE
jgi:pyruvate,water dikinase